MHAPARPHSRASAPRTKAASVGEPAVDAAGAEKQPRYVAIKDSIFEDIREGRLKPGDQTPSEAELVETFKVSRMTANRALRELQSAGVVVRRAGRGSFVAEPRPIGQLIEIRNIADEVRSRGHAYRARVVHNVEIRADAERAALLEVGLGTRLFHSLIVHHETEFPIQVEERFVLASAAPRYGERDFSASTPNEYLTRVAPLERVEHRVCAAMPDTAMRTMLGLAEGEPVLMMTRRTWSRGRLVSHAWLTHPGNRFELSAAFSVGT